MVFRKQQSWNEPIASQDQDVSDHANCQANDKLTYLNERQIDLPVDVRFLRFFGSQRGVQRADGCELP